MGSGLNILWLGLKEIRSLVSDIVLLLFVIYAFTWTVNSQATGTTNEVNNASLAFVDEDHSALSKQLHEAFYPPRFQRPVEIQSYQVEDAMDRGRFMFVVVIPPNFESDLHAGRHPAVPSPTARPRNPCSSGRGRRGSGTGRPGRSPRSRSTPAPDSPTGALPIPRRAGP